MNVADWVLVSSPGFFLGPPNLAVNSPNARGDPTAIVVKSQQKKW